MPSEKGCIISMGMWWRDVVSDNNFNSLDMNNINKTNATCNKVALSRIEAAAYLEISTSSLDRLVKRGFLNPCRALRKPLFTIKQLDRFLSEQTQERA